MKAWFAGYLLLGSLIISNTVFAASEGQEALRQGDAYRAIIACKRQLMQNVSAETRRCLFEAAAGARDWTLAEKQWQRLENETLAESWRKEMAWWRGHWDVLRSFPKPERADDAAAAAVLVAHELDKEPVPDLPAVAAVAEPWRSAVTLELRLARSQPLPEKLVVQALQQAGDWPMALAHGLGERLEHSHPESALSFWQAWLERHPEDRLAQRHLVEWALNASRLDLAARWLKSLGSNDWPDRYLRARFDLQSGNIGEAARQFAALLEHAPYHQNTRWFLALSQVGLQQWEKALQTLEPIVESRASWLPARRLQLQILLTLGRWQDAWEQARAIMQEPPDDMATRLMAVMAATKTGHLATAVGWLKTAEMPNDPAWEQEWTRVASEVHVLASGQWPPELESRLPWWSALARYQTVPESITPEEGRQWPMEKRLATAWKGMLAGKLEVARSLLPPLPQSLAEAPDLWLRLHAELAMRAGDDGQARDLWQVLRERHPKDATLCMRVLQVTDTASPADWQQCWESNPDDLMATRLYLDRLETKHQWQQAIVVVRHWQTRWPEWPFSWRSAARVYLESQQADDAWDALGELVMRSPSDVALPGLLRQWLVRACEAGSFGADKLVALMTTPLWKRQSNLLLQFWNDAQGKACLLDATLGAETQDWQAWSPASLLAWAGPLATMPGKEAGAALMGMADARPDVPELVHQAARHLRQFSGGQKAREYLLRQMAQRQAQPNDEPWRGWLAELDTD